MKEKAEHENLNFQMEGGGYIETSSIQACVHRSRRGKGSMGTAWARLIREKV